MHRLLTGPLTVDRLTLTIADLPPDLTGTRIVQLSDLHFDGIRLSEQLLTEAIAATNQVDPDLIVLTGDYITDQPEAIQNLVQHLKHLQSRAGIYAVMGNHDLRYRRSRQIITDALESISIQVLWNQIVYPLGPGLALVGLAEFWSPEFCPDQVLSQVPATTPRIVLSHNPDTAERMKEHRVDLQLSGHTHGGQLVIPGLGNLSAMGSYFYRSLPKRAKRMLPILKECHRVVQRWDLAQGLHTVGENRLYVNRGLGTYLPGRLFCPPEVTVIQLEHPSRSETSSQGA